MLGSGASYSPPQPVLRDAKSIPPPQQSNNCSVSSWRFVRAPRLVSVRLSSGCFPASLLLCPGLCPPTSPCPMFTLGPEAPSLPSAAHWQGEQQPLPEARGLLEETMPSALTAKSGESSCPSSSDPGLTARTAIHRNLPKEGGPCIQPEAIPQALAAPQPHAQ